MLSLCVILQTLLVSYSTIIKFQYYETERGSKLGQVPLGQMHIPVVSIGIMFGRPLHQRALGFHRRTLLA